MDVEADGSHPAVFLGRTPFPRESLVPALLYLEDFVLKIGP